MYKSVTFIQISLTQHLFLFSCIQVVASCSVKWICIQKKARAIRLHHIGSAACAIAMLHIPDITNNTNIRQVY